MTLSTWLTRSRLLVIAFGLAVALGGACNCDDDPDPDPDVGNDVEEDVDDGVPEDMARLQVVHEVADPDADVVDVYFDDELIIDDFEYRTATPFTDVDAGEYEIAVAPGDSDSADDALATFEPGELEEGERYLLVASGVLEPDDFEENPDGEDIDLALYLLDNARQSSSDEDVDELVLFHGVTDAPAIDVDVDDENVVSDLAYGNFTDGYLSLPTGTTVLDVIESDTEELVESYETPDLAGGDSWVGLASGFLDDAQNQDASFEIVVYPTPVGGDRLNATLLDVADDNGDETAQLQLIHDSIDPGASPVDVFIDDERVAEDLEFRDATAFVTVPAGETVEVAITEAGAEDTAGAPVSETVEFNAGSNHIGVVTGVVDPGDFPDNPDGVPTDIDVHLFDDARQDSDEADAADFLTFHGVMDAPPVDVNIEAEGDDFLVGDNLTYRNFGDYTSVPGDDGATISLATGADPETPIVEFDIDTNAHVGNASTIVVSGVTENGDLPSVAFVIAGSDGDTTVFE